ncbi:hypothetical protein O6H91_02G074200 [Diphasiastrum complanatum]|uniref:Uncharacterized protein n=1 Tax=Diphasiastrum complanatum TaxID=34168 RepID=A0ACC2EH95_DIPCM|nr:hypothetical protein O6H91_02G074200 [Diphasiastrum complanatum]
MGVHPVFHVSLLKSYLGSGEILISSDDIDQLRSLSKFIPLETEFIVDVRFKKLHSKEGPKYLIRWKGKSDEDDTWEAESFLRRKFPDFS